MPGIMDTIYGPIAKEYCIYFYVLSIIGFVFLCLLLLTMLFSLFFGKKNKYYSQLIMFAVTYAIVYFHMYFQNRLLYNMCASSR